MHRQTERYIVPLWIIFIALVFPAFVEATVIYSENFDSATPGQSVSADPLNWNWPSMQGTVKVGKGNHPGWAGNAIIGSLTIPAWGFWGYAGKNIDAIPNSGVVTLTYDAWAYSECPGGQNVTLFGDNTYVFLEYNNNGISRHGDWAFSAGIFGGTSAYSWSPQHFLEDQTVFCKMVLDYDQHQTWAELSDGSSIWKSDVFSFTGSPQLSVITIMEDVADSGSIGGDIDNIVLSATSVPDYASAASLLGFVVTGLFGFSRKWSKNKIG
jgi:hypothetical protein